MKKFALVLMAAALVLSIGSTSAFAGGREPGSLLVFPLYDTANITFFTVTNTNSTVPIWVEFRYINGLTCQKSDRPELLTPMDTLTVLANLHNSDPGVGYLYVFAQEVSGGPPVSHNWLIGQASIINTTAFSEFSYNPYAFNAVQPQGQPTDVDQDGILDLDNVEYEQAPDLILQPRFFGQADFSGPGFQSQIVIINLTGGSQFEAQVNFDIYNDDEKKASRTLFFTCWIRIPLAAISGAFNRNYLKSLGDDPDEVFGLPILESGWFVLDGIVANSDCTEEWDPAVLSLLIESIGVFSGADLPFQTGVQDNGDLLPRGCFGDP